MKARVVVDNIGSNDLKGEWGLCIYIEHEGKKILLDSGGSELFVENSKKMDIDLADIDYAVLSHAHCDHANGTQAFFDRNKKAKLYVQQKCADNCYFKIAFIKAYVGTPKGILKKNVDRVEYVSEDLQIMTGVSIVGHKTEGLEKYGKKNHMYRYEAGKWVPDDFSHEQSLVVETSKGLVIFNSCSHGGADNIINEVKMTFPDKKIYAIVGGFHLAKRPAKEVRQLAVRIRETGIEKVYTGHCTGKKSYNVLKEELGDKLEQLYVGLEIEC